MTDPIKKPLSNEIKSRLNLETKFVWLHCSKCGCEFEVTENRSKEWPVGQPCADCLNEEDQEKEKTFCILCGKFRPSYGFSNIPLARFVSGRVFSIDACGACKVIVHNIRRMVGDAERQDIKKMNEDNIKEVPKEGLIVVPQLKVPKNIRS